MKSYTFEGYLTFGSGKTIPLINWTEDKEFIRIGKKTLYITFDSSVIAKEHELALNVYKLEVTNAKNLRTALRVLRESLFIHKLDFYVKHYYRICADKGGRVKISDRFFRDPLVLPV